ncbi:MAG: asparaginase [Actinobacteria bacterium]|nr:asparaginase [Actinomycetota bacterium]
MVESQHFGAVVALERDGSVAFSIGDADTIVYPRSSMKPLQATAMVSAGLDLPPQLLALVCASHDGRPEHLAAALEILKRAGLDESALGNTTDYPLDETEHEKAIREGKQRTSLQMNCSGKHSGMLATCVAAGWKHDLSYLSPDHPLQRHITATIPSLAGEPAAHIGVDGCGAPAHAMSLVGLARAFRSVAIAEPGTPQHRVAQAMTSHPEMVGGPTRDVTRLMQGVPGLVAKDGAEAVFAVGLPDGRAVALKVSDGANRARPPVMQAALARLGVGLEKVDPATWDSPVWGHGRRVGLCVAAGPLVTS